MNRLPLPEITTWAWLRSRWYLCQFARTAPWSMIEEHAQHLEMFR